MAHIEKRGPSRWRARYRAPDGRERSKTFTKKVDAERWLNGIEVSKARGDWVDPSLGRITVADWAERWFATTVNLKPKTRVGYRSLLDRHVLPAFGGWTLAGVQPLDVREWVAELSGRLSPSRVRQAYRVLSALMGSAADSGYIDRSPCHGVHLPRMPHSKMLFLDAGQVESLVAEMDYRYKTLVQVLGYGGLRWGEAAALRRGRCQLLRGRLEVNESLAEVGGHLHFGPTKTHSNREVALPPFLVESLAHHLATGVDHDGAALVFTSPDGGPLRHGNFTRRFWRPAVDRAPVPEGLRIHDLRHTAASLLIATGAHVKAVQSQLGHKSATTTLDRYGHLFPDDLDRLAEALGRARSEAAAASTRPRQGTGAVMPIKGASEIAS